MESDQIQKITLERFPSSGELPFVCLSIKAASALLNVLLWWFWWTGGPPVVVLVEYCCYLCTNTIISSYQGCSSFERNIPLSSPLVIIVMIIILNYV